MPQEHPKPTKLYYKSYLEMIRGSLGSEMFQRLYIDSAGGSKDVLNSGMLSCAYYVSSILKVFGRIDSFHATVSRTVEEMEKAGWRTAKLPKSGDIVVWESVDYGEVGHHKHIGFFMKKNRAISHSWTKRVPVEHDLNFNGSRAIERIMTTDW